LKSIRARGRGLFRDGGKGGRGGEGSEPWDVPTKYHRNTAGNTTDLEMKRLGPTKRHKKKNGTGREGGMI